MPKLTLREVAHEAREIGFIIEDLCITLTNVSAVLEDIPDTPENRVARTALENVAADLDFVWQELSNVQRNITDSRYTEEVYG